MRLKGKVAIVTGAAQGIGRGCALQFAKEGAKVAVADLQAEQGRETVRLIEAAGSEAIFVQTDVSKEEEVRNLVEATIARWGRLDILLNNAGYAAVKLVEDSTAAEWDHLMAVNLKSMFLGVKFAVPIMRKQGGGAIINMGSISGLTGQMRTPAYVASKGAVVMLTKSLALDYGCDNIRVNCICPGITDTPALRKHIDSSADPEALIRERLSRVPLGRFLTPEDIGRAAVYLASDDSDGITGIAHIVDGGLLAAAEYSSTWLPKKAE
jgi:NAD(P)-dependent dehydrogenase (short-subunit alcohol dehydrogenase family)